MKEAACRGVRGPLGREPVSLDSGAKILQTIRNHTVPGASRGGLLSVAVARPDDAAPASVRVEGYGIEAVVLAGGSPYLNGVTIEAVMQNSGLGIRVSATGGAGSPRATIGNSRILSGAGSQRGVTTSWCDGLPLTLPGTVLSG